MTATTFSLTQLCAHNAYACLPAVQCCHVSITKLPTKQGSVFSLALRADTLGQGHKALLQAPAQQHLHTRKCGITISNSKALVETPAHTA